MDRIGIGGDGGNGIQTELNFCARFNASGPERPGLRYGRVRPAGSSGEGWRTLNRGKRLALSHPPFR